MISKMARDRDVVGFVVALFGGYSGGGGGDKEHCGDVEAKWKKLRVGIWKEVEFMDLSFLLFFMDLSLSLSFGRFLLLFSALKPLFVVRAKSIGGEDIGELLDGWESVLGSKDVDDIFVVDWVDILCVHLIAFCLKRRDNDGAHLDDSSKKVLEKVLETSLPVRYKSVGDVWDRMAWGIYISGPKCNVSSMSRKTHFLEDFLSVAFSSSFVQNKCPKFAGSAFFRDLAHPEEELWGNDSESYERKAGWICEYREMVESLPSDKTYILAQFVFEIIKDNRFHPKSGAVSWEIDFPGIITFERVDPVSKKTKTQEIERMLRDHTEQLRKQEEESAERERQRKIHEEEQERKIHEEEQERKIREEEEEERQRKIREEEEERQRKMREEEEKIHEEKERQEDARREMKEWRHRVTASLDSLPGIVSSLDSFPVLVSTLSDLAAPLTQIVDKAACVDLLRKEVEGLRSEVGFLRARDEVRVVSVNSQIQSQQDELQSQRAKIEAQQNEIAAQKDKIESLLAQIAAVQEQKAAASTVTSLESKSLREQIESLQTARIEFDGTNHEFKTTTMATTNDITTIVPTVESLQIESAPGHGSLDHDIAYDFEAEKKLSQTLRENAPDKSSLSTAPLYRNTLRKELPQITQTAKNCLPIKLDSRMLLLFPAANTCESDAVNGQSL